MRFSTAISTPNGQPTASRNARAATAAVFLAGSFGSRPPSPEIDVTTTSRPSALRTVTASPGRSRAKPSTSKPEATLATVGRGEDRHRPRGAHRGRSRAQERVVDRADRGDVLPARDDERDVALRGALRDHQHVHPGGAEGAEDPARDAGRAAHVLADHGDDDQVAHELELLEAPGLQLERELAAERAEGPVRLAGLEHQRDRVLGRGLGDHDDVHALAGQGGEDARRDAGDADHAAALDVQQRDALDRGDARDRVLGPLRPRCRSGCPAPTGSACS